MSKTPKSEWQPKIHYSIDQAGYLLYMMRRVEEGRLQFLCGDGTIKTPEPGQYDGQLWLAKFDEPGQLRALIEEAENQGVQSPSSDRITGELTATKAHLEDMRKLIFKNRSKS